MAKIRKIITLVLIALLVLGLAGYLVYASLQMSHTDPEARCKQVQLIVEKSKGQKFVDENSIEALLRDAGLYPKDKMMDEVNTMKIEEVLRNNEFIAEVECYKSSSDKFCVKIRQREPVIYILPDGRSGYFVDATGKKISNTNYATNIITATGTIDQKYATTSLMELGAYIGEDQFWNDQIEQIYVKMNNEGNPVIELIPRVGNHVVYLGSVDDYDKKLRRLKVFYEKAMGTVGWNKYEVISLEYGNQIVCKKKK